MESGKPKVVITGVSGYIGSWVCKYFLDDGGYDVRGTVRDPSNKKKIDPLLKGLGENADNLELVAADLSDAKSLDKACEGCEYVIHVASPFPNASPKNEDEVLTPAIQGTEFIVNAVIKNNCKRLVLTSSCYAIIDFAKGDGTCDENDWTEITKLTKAYDKSKILAEKKAWDMLKD